MSSQFDNLPSPFRGGGPRRLSRKMIHGVHAIEVLLDRPRNSMYCAQGSWNRGYAPSAGTHDKSGVADWYCRGFEDDVVKAGRKIGMIGYHRDEARGGFVGDDEHVHMITHGDPGMGDYALLQDRTYMKDRDGLGAGAAAGPDQEWAPRDRTVTLNIGAWTGEWAVTAATYGYSQASKDADLRRKRRAPGFVIRNQLCTVTTGNGRLYVVTDNGTFYDRSKLKMIKRLKSRTA